MLADLPIELEAFINSEICGFREDNMREWVAAIVGENMATGVMLVLVTLAIVIAFVILLAVFRGFTGGRGIRGGGRSRQARLAVMDAAVVDSKRRLVLVRRDDVEHLVMIGGPVDVVVEQNIRRNPQGKPAAARPQMRPVPKQAKAPPPAPVKAAPAAPARMAPAAPAKSAPAARQATPPVQQPAAAPVRQATPPAAPAVPAAPVQKPAPAAPENKLHGTISRAAVSAASVTAATAKAASTAGSTPQVEPQAAPVPRRAAAAPAPTISTAPQPVKSVPPETTAKNQLESFEDVLAMDKGKTLVPDADTTSNTLASEMDELLSEITGGTKPKT